MFLFAPHDLSRGVHYPDHISNVAHEIKFCQLLAATQCIGDKGPANCPKYFYIEKNILLKVSLSTATKNKHVPNEDLKKVLSLLETTITIVDDEMDDEW